MGPDCLVGFQQPRRVKVHRANVASPTLADQVRTFNLWKAGWSPEAWASDGLISVAKELLG